MTRSRGGGRRGEGRGGGGGGGKPGRGGGFGNTTIGEELRIAVNLALKNFRQREEETELEFPSSLLSTERAYVHKLATELGLASKSRGKGQTRYLTVFKKEGSTLLARDAELSLSDSCLRMCSSLLQRAPVTSKERALLMPVQERERGSAAPDVSGGGSGGRSMGRLGGGVAQVPPRPSASEDLIASKERLPIFEKRDAVMAAINSAQVNMFWSISYNGPKLVVFVNLFIIVTTNKFALGGDYYWRYRQWENDPSGSIYPGGCCRSR